MLINVDRAARLEWRSYSRYSGVPEGSVAAVDESSASAVGDNDVFIGRHLSASTWLPGSIEVPRRSANFGVMRVFDSKGNMSEQATGDILVEVEPVRYEMELHSSVNNGDDQPRRSKKVVRSDVELAKSSLFRFDEGKDLEARMQKVLSYQYEKSEYYGQVWIFQPQFCVTNCQFVSLQIPGMLRALPTSIRLPKGQVQSVLWGLADKSEQHETIMVGHALQHFRAVDVSVVGVRITEETPYRATLHAIFPDGSRRQRSVEGVVQRIYLDNIRPEYSRVYHIKEAQTSMASSKIPSTTTLGPPPARHHLQNNHDKDKSSPEASSSVVTVVGQTAKDRILSEHQLLMASSSASMAFQSLVKCGVIALTALYTMAN